MQHSTPPRWSSKGGWVGQEARGECKEVESDSVLCKNENKAATGVSKGSPPQDDTELAWAAGAAKAITQGTEGRTAKGHKLQRAPTRSREQVPPPLEAPCKPAFPFVPPKTHFRLLPKMELWVEPGHAKAHDKMQQPAGTQGSRVFSGK